MPSRNTRPYAPAHDLEWLHGLWQRTLNTRWHLSAAELQKKINNASSLVAEQAGRRIGFCAVGYKDHGPAGVLAILVEPAYQRQGVGTLLVEELERGLKDSSIPRLNVGCGNDGSYFWPGLPADADAAWKLFTKLGWKEEEPSFDLVQELADYHTPSWVYGRLTSAGVSLQLAELDFREKIVSFEQKWFPAWAEFFENATAGSEYDSILLALDARKEVIGSVLLKARVSAIWDADLGLLYGTLNVLGVAESEQGKGVGIALAARAMEILKERQCTKCYVQWTGLIDWYGKLGTKVWAEYHMGSKKLF